MKRLLLLLAVVAVALYAVQCTKILDAIGGACAALFITDDDEVQMGTEYYNEIVSRTGEYPLLNEATNAEFYTYFRGIGAKLVAAQDDRPEEAPLRYKWTIIDDTTINAFAVPGGYIFVYAGLVRKCANEAQLAGVMAHELGHVTKRHGAESMCSSGLIATGTSIVLGDSSLIGQIVDGLVFMNAISKPNEFQADSCAIEYLASAGYNPYGMRDFLDTLYAMGGDDFWLEAVLSSHPKNSERIAKVESRIPKISGARTTDEFLYAQQYATMKSKLALRN